jgi:hypothetical protein
LSTTRYGRIAVAEPPSSLARTHWHAGGELKVVSHPPTIPPLDQQDLEAQGIDTATLIPGARKVDALGSCVANATTACLSATLPEGSLSALGIGSGAVADEEFAIRLYHNLTMLTGNPSTEWPPDDTGSSGLFVCQYLESHDVISGHRIAHGPESILSLMQQGPLIAGQPFLNAWEEPGSDHFIDGDGSLETLARDIAGGVAGGHETCLYSIEDIGYDDYGAVDLFRTVLRFRNSWGSSWNDRGDGLVHLSAFVALGNYCDFRLLIA